MRSGYDCLKSHVLRCWRNDVNHRVDVVSSGRAFQMRGAATGKARLPTVESLTEGTTRRLVPAERSVRRCHRPCRSATGTSGLGEEGLDVANYRFAYCNTAILGYPLASPWREQRGQLPQLALDSILKFAQIRWEVWTHSKGVWAEYGKDWKSLMWLLLENPIANVMIYEE